MKLAANSKGRISFAVGFDIRETKWGPLHLMSDTELLSWVSQGNRLYF